MSRDKSAIKKLEGLYVLLREDRIFRVGLLALAYVLVFLVVVDVTYLSLIKNSCSCINSDLCEFMENILIESHGLLFDLAVFGFVFEGVRVVYKRNEEIKRYEEEIDDFRNWKEKEAMFRIIGNIKRLNRLDVNEIDLHNTYLAGGNLKDLNLTGSNLSHAILTDTYLEGTRLVECNLYNANLDNSYIGGADFSGVEFTKNSIEKMEVIMSAPGGGEGKGTIDATPKNGGAPSMKGVSGQNYAKMDIDLRACIQEQNDSFEAE